MSGESAELRKIKEHAIPVTGARGDYDALIDLIGDARVVLLGEASHGTHEFYQERARITRRLIEEKGFNAVAVEADWPDAYRVNRYVRGISDDATPLEALDDFQRFPLWMWRNQDIVTLIEWLREHNLARPESARVGFYGLDLYSLYGSIDAVLDYLDKADPEAAARARQRYSCFEEFGEDSQAYGYSAALGSTGTCEEQAIQQLLEIRAAAKDIAPTADAMSADEHFAAEQNARLVKNAEEYYRAMFRGRKSTWNLRDCHMADTLEALSRHFGEGSRIVVWEHNSHIGDARATDMSRSGEWNVGQLARERFGKSACLVGFSTYTGTVTAATDWNEPAQRRRVRPGLPGSWEELFHGSGIPSFLLLLQDADLRSALSKPRLQRAIGVIYRPETERGSHYFAARVPEQFDAVIHIDETKALEPLERSAIWEKGEVPDTFPFEL